MVRLLTPWGVAKVIGRWIRDRWRWMKWFSWQ
jgi:hypothetical protein